ncbi:MAG TPA: hypothetical protein VF669_23440 [Tepidisphaeraceae bacterium]|jgi:flagellar biosynthesis/type III secretory pathway M-ring protein FliF/YscJ
MSLFNEQLDRVQSQLISLSTGRKIFWGCLLAAVIAAGIFWQRNDRQVAWEPVLDQALDATQLAQISSHLSEKQVPFRSSENRIMVPADRKFQILADLLYEDLLPNNTESGFDALAKTSIWDSSSKVERMYIHVKEQQLRNVISRFPGVKKATVVIDPTSEQHINGSVTPSALVDIQTKSGARNARQLATAAVNVVTGAQSNLTRDKVQVTIDGAPVRSTIDPNQMASDEQIERTQQREQFYVAKVRKQLAFVPDALISVTVQLPMPAARKAMSSAATQGAGDVVANMGVTLAAKRDVEQVTSASVAVPRSYFMSIYLRANPNAPDPSDGVLQPIIDAELTNIRKLVRNTLGIRNEDDVTVASYVDQQPLTAPGNAVQTAAAPLTMLMYNRTVQIAVGLSALMLLVIAPLLLLRRPKPVGASVSSRPIHAALLSPRGEDYADEDFGEEDADQPMGHYPDVQALVQDSPDATATLLEKWINQR